MLKSKAEIDGQLELPFDLVFIKPKLQPDQVPHYEKPGNDNEQLMEYQYRYKIQGDNDALRDLYTLAYTIAAKIVSQECTSNKRFKQMPLWERYEKAEDAVVYIISSLIRKPLWFIKKSFTGYIFLRVQHELKYARKVDKIVDFVDLSEFFKEGTEDDDNSDFYD